MSNTRNQASGIIFNTFLLLYVTYFCFKLRNVDHLFLLLKKIQKDLIDYQII